MGKQQKNQKYSVVMSVYAKDKPEWFEQAIQSLLNQTVISNDIIIVVDGPLTPQLNAILRQYSDNKIISIIKLRKNQGLGNALNVGIARTKNELIARMDSDDISVPNRCELQLEEFAKNPQLEILGGQIAEFVGSPDEIVAYRKVPIVHKDIDKFSKRRSPFNHPTVMYKKSAIQKLNGYDVTAIRIEDYDLWLRALSSGVICANLDNVLLKYRSTSDAMARRKTLISWKNHVNARFRFYKKGYISLADFLYGFVTQTMLLITPRSVASSIFKKVVRV